MKKVRNLIYRSNEWYDDLPDGKRFLFFFIVICGGNVLANIALVVYDNIYAMPIWFSAVALWRLPYLLRPKKKYVFDIETTSLHGDTPIIAYRDVLKDAEPKIIETGKFDRQSMANFFSMEEQKPTLTDVFKKINNKEDKNQ